MNKLKLKITVLLLMISGEPLFCQDFHFSQNDALTQYLNPALTGMYWDEYFNWRINLAYRSQWAAMLRKNFTNQYLAFDMPYNDNIGIGGYIVNNRAGSGNFNTFNFMLGGAYRITIDPTNTHNLFGGLHIGIFNRSVKTSNLIFDSQFIATSSGYSPSLSSNENFGDESIWRIDANMGFYYRYNDKNKIYKPWGGFAIYRVTMPNGSFSEEISRIPLRWNLMAGCDIIINDKHTIKPLFMTMFQGKYREVIISANHYYIMNEIWEITGGLSIRPRDAVIISAGAVHNKCLYRISYDITTSYLKNYNHYYGAIELTVIYIFNKGTHNAKLVNE